MPTTPKSGDKITRDSISTMQSEVAASGQALTIDDFSRGAIGSEHLHDTVIYCARNLIAPTQGQLGRSVAYPETQGGPHWRSTPLATNEVIWYANARERWDTIDAYSSELHGYAAFSAGENVSEPIGMGTEAGSHFFRIPNEGNGFSMLFYANVRFRWNLGIGNEGRTFNHWETWDSGERFWTSIVYYLKPNSNSKKVLKWSHADLIGASASVQNDYESGAGTAMFGEGTSQSAQIDELIDAALGKIGFSDNKWKNTEIVHSYQDIVTINQQTIDRLAEYSGFDVEADNLKLEDGRKCFFGWTVNIASDRWDYRDVTTTSMTERDSDREPTYENGQQYRVAKGNVGFIAFKYDPKSATRLVDSF
mgnify:CR=1 FL=1